jgi:TalC/MipB family fructose-6-phosphate aldolase
MEIWLDTINIGLIKLAKKLGILHGVTTNPSIISQSKSALEDIIAQILEAQSGPVTVQVLAEEASMMIEQGLRLKEFSSRIVIKVPLTPDGLETIHTLSLKKIPTMATVVFDPSQVLLASAAGATYVAPYISQIERQNEDSDETVKQMLSIIGHARSQTKIIAASIQHVQQVKHFASMGIHAITLKDQVFLNLIQTHQLTNEGIERFAVDWKKAKATKLL